MGIALTIGCKGNSSQNPAPEKPEVPARPLIVPPLAGQTIAVLPLTMIISDPGLGAEAPLMDRTTALHWADSSLSLALTIRAPDVSWVLPPELRRMAHRAPSLNVDPDKMGQSIMGAPKITTVPDPLRTYARSLVAIAGGRLVLIPAFITFNRTPEGTVKAEVSIVMADARSGQVVWRTLIPAVGPTPLAALDAAYRLMLPLPSDQP
ncbi:MAG TPA: hypothetical protein VGP80_14900 [Gemmatimonadales bacterium]|nr:hypothetical protein [Gemmatimonadales bacterium]